MASTKRCKSGPDGGGALLQVILGDRILWNAVSFVKELQHTFSSAFCILYQIK
jgi:hypothetical protein